jgi:hypothetical protein
MDFHVPARGCRHDVERQVEDVAMLVLRHKGVQRFHGNDRILGDRPVF